jgi:Protein of unknown function (DUF1217).
MMSTLVSYRMITKDLTRSLQRTASSPQVERDSKYYLENIQKVKSIDDFLSDHRVYSFAMKAFGLEDMIYAKAYMRKVLTEGVDDSKSFANRLADKRFAEFAKTFNFARYGETTTAFSATREGTVERYVRQLLEEQAGAENEGVRLALYFQRKAPELKSVYGILADRALLAVVQTALGIPAEASAADIEVQAKMIEAKLNIEDFKDPEKLDKFLQRFAAAYDATNMPLAVSAPVLTLFGNSAQTAGMGVDLLMSLQKIKTGL